MFDGEKTWKVKLIKCPRCFVHVELEGKSSMSIKNALKDVIFKAREHSKKSCFFRNSHPEVNKGVVVVFQETRTDTKIKSEWIENNFIII